MQNLDFQNPVRIIFGQGSRKEIGKTLGEVYHKMLLMVGRGIPSAYIQALSEDLRENGIQVFETDPVDSNPRVSSVRKAADLCRTEKIEAIIALGGGSTMDCAKMTGASAATGLDVCSFLWGDVQPITASIPVITVPTIAATGTELNNTAVIRNELTKKKSSCAAACMYPAYSFIDPEYAEKLPKRIAMWGAMDVLSHTFEYYFNGYYSPFQLRFSEGIILAALECISHLARDGYDPFYYGELMWTAAMTWGTGLTRIGRGLPDMACHTIEEGVGAYYDTHHGAGLGIITPNWMRFVCDKKPEIFARFARNIWGVQEKNDQCAAREGISRMESFLAKTGIETSYRQLTDQITDERLECLAREIYQENNGVVGRLVPLSIEDIYKVLSMSCR